MMACTKSHFTITVGHHFPISNAPPFTKLLSSILIYTRIITCPHLISLAITPFHSFLLVQSQIFTSLTPYTPDLPHLHLSPLHLLSKPTRRPSLPPLLSRDKAHARATDIHGLSRSTVCASRARSGTYNLLAPANRVEALAG